MLKRLTIRPATVADTESAASLIGMTLEGLAVHLFGAERLKSIVSESSTQRSNRFSHQFADIAETRGRIAGLLLSYPGRMISRLGLSTGHCLYRILGAIPFIRFVRRALPFAFAPESRSDEYFINTLAVFPEFRREGIGTSLLAHAESKARQLNLMKCALTVEFANLRARDLYDRLGYQAAQSVSFTRSKRQHASEGYHRMVRAL